MAPFALVWSSKEASASPPRVARAPRVAAASSGSVPTPHMGSQNTSPGRSSASCSRSCAVDARSRAVISACGSSGRGSQGSRPRRKP
eukprot:6622730-Prymnesium_polylepis.1